MICLGIESTAHTFGIGIIRFEYNPHNNHITPTTIQILANCKASFTSKKAGMIPSQVADHHVDVCDTIIMQALQKANLKLKDIDLISYSASPGIGHTLRIGAMVARSLALKLKMHKLNVPVAPVNHCIAHLEIGRLLTKAKDPILLYVSGANTQVISYEAGKYRIIGETLDIGIGNFLDTLARELNLGFPGGPKIQELAKNGKKLIELPYSIKGMDMNFGGLLTYLKQLINQPGFFDEYTIEDLCFSVQETVFALMTEVAERALAHCDKNELLLGGGVACNTRLQEMCAIMCKERGAACYILPNEYNVDNGAMIAWLGILEHSAGNYITLRTNAIKNAKKIAIDPYLRTDEVEIKYR
ncbi:tRNA (adenosine(37)-N6)-threonylcarbamoyltransferase complex transferase subunit TsaD [Candidatus Woesearchaeota archaeon]|nr:tRNA (adenosine(37)-N6)-threonylcarbamoyltransferase complex transferase subunit TsaD [Candidatus Woesearchaeota archaeon]